MRRSVRLFLIFGLFAVLLLSAAGCALRQSQEPPVIPVVIEPSGARVAYLGPEGTYTQEACLRFFGDGAVTDAYETVDLAVQALSDGNADYAVIPQENTIGGAVTEYVDILISSDGISVVGEIELPISQNLLALPGTELSDIKTVYSHRQGLVQGRQWLIENLPDAELVVVSSTAEGARIVSEKADPSCAAVASAGCAEVYSLEILASGIQENDLNVTRFYVLSVAAPATAEADRLLFVASGNAQALPELMSGIDSMGITLVSIHDRPEKTGLGQYLYIIELSGCSYKEYLSLADDAAFEFRYLGSFSVR